MYQNILTLGLIFLASVTKISLAPALFPAHVVPDVLLILVIIWSARKTFESFWPWALASGIILDFVSLERIGVNTISFLIISFLVDFLSRRFFINQRKSMFFWVAALVFLGIITNYLLLSGMYFFIGNLNPGVFNLRSMLFELLNDMLVFAFIFWPVNSSKIIFPIEESRLVIR